MLLTTILTFLLTVSAASSSGTVLRMSQADPIPDSCLLDVSVYLENVSNMTAFSVRLTFDPTVVQVVEVSNGDFLTDGLPEPSNGFDNSAGIVQFGMARINDEGGGSPPESGSGELVHLRMLALQAETDSGMAIDSAETNLVGYPDYLEINYTVDPVEIHTGRCAAARVYLPLIKR